MARRSKKLSREEKMEVEEWIYQNNTEEKRLSDTMTINVKCKTENQKALVVTELEGLEAQRIKLNNSLKELREDLKKENN